MINKNFEIGVKQPSISILKLVSASHQCQFWNWCLPAVTHFHFRLHIWHMYFKHIYTLHIFVIFNEITYDLSLLQVQFSSRSGRHKSWNFSRFLTKNCSTVNSKGNSILKMVFASNLYQFEIGVCQQSITFLKLVSNSHQYQFWNWCLPAVHINLKLVSASNQ